MQSKMCSKLWASALVAAGISGTALAGGPWDGWPQPIGPDITICQLYGLSSFGRVGTYPNGTSGLSVATTSWNIGNAQALWEESPDSDHPFIAMDLFRKKTWQVNGVTVDRLEQIGQSWCKHGFFALSNQQCGTHPWAGQNGVPASGNCQGTNGTRLGVGCTDTYSSSLNAQQSNLGPRFEINGWTGVWNYQGSMFQVGGPSNTGIRRRLQVRDQDLIPPSGHTYNLYVQGYYVAWDDVDVMTSAGWKPINSYSWNGSAYTFSMSGSTVDEIMGFAIDAWTGARKIMIAQQFPIIERWTANADGPGGLQESPDGRAIIAWKVFDLQNGTWQYEYAVLNIDMDRQIGSFSIPIPNGVVVTNVGSSIVLNHDEPLNSIGGKPINNNPWSGTVRSGDVLWETEPYNPTSTPSNPIRWGNMANFWFTANTPPDTAMATVGLFKPGTPTSLVGEVEGPSAVPPPPHCLGDANGDFVVDFADIGAILANWGATYKPGSAGLGDSNNDGVVSFADISTTLGVFFQNCF